MPGTEKYAGTKVQTIYLDNSREQNHHVDREDGEDMEALERLVQKDADNYKKAQEELQAMWELFDTAEGKRQLEELQRERDRSALLERQKEELHRQKREHERLLIQQREEAEAFKAEQLRREQAEIHAEIRKASAVNSRPSSTPRQRSRQYPAGERTYDVVRGRSVSPKNLTRNSNRKPLSAPAPGFNATKQEEEVVAASLPSPDDPTTESVDITMEEEDRWVHRVVVMEREDKLHTRYKEKIRVEKQKVKELQHQVNLLASVPPRTSGSKVGEKAESQSAPQQTDNFDESMKTYLDAQRELLNSSVDQLKEFIADALVVAVGGAGGGGQQGEHPSHTKSSREEEELLELRNKRESLKEAEIALEKRIRRQDEAERQMQAFIDRSKRQLELEHSEALSRVAKKEEEVRHLRSSLMNSSLLVELSALQMSAGDKTLRLVERERQLLQREEDLKHREAALRSAEEQVSRAHGDVEFGHQHTQERLAALESTLLSTKQQLEDEWESLASAKATFTSDQDRWRQEHESFLASRRQQGITQEEQEAEYHKNMETVRLLRAELEADREALLAEKEQMIVAFEKHQNASREELEAERVKVKVMHDEASKLFEEREEELRSQSIALQKEVAKAQEDRAQNDLQTTRLLQQESTLEQLQSKLEKERALIRRERESLERDLLLGSETITKNYSSISSSARGQPGPSTTSSPASSITSSTVAVEDKLRKKQSLEKLQEVYKILNKVGGAGDSTAAASSESTSKQVATPSKEVTFATRGSNLTSSEQKKDLAGKKVIVSPLRSPSFPNQNLQESTMLSQQNTVTTKEEEIHWRSAQNTFAQSKGVASSSLSDQEERDDKELERGLAALESIFVHYRSPRGRDTIDASPNNTMALPRNIYALQREWLELHRLRRENVTFREVDDTNRRKYLAVRDDWWARLRTEASHYFEHVGARLF